MNLSKNKKEANKGITLIALVITIIVLLILAGVAIATLVGENGILTQAQNARIQSAHAEVKEYMALEYNEYQIEIRKPKTTAEKEVTKIASTEVVKIAETQTETQQTFKEYLVGQEIIDPDTGIVNVEKLVGRDLILGNGTTTDVYKVEDMQNGAYELKYYDEEGTSEKIWDTTNMTTGGVTPPPVDDEEEIVTVAPTASKVTKNTKYQDASSGNKIAVIPVGFAVVPGCTKIDDGLVISDVADDRENTGNQFVWIPVNNTNPFQRRAGYYNGGLQNITGFGEADSTGVNSVLESSAAGSGSGSQSASVSQSGSGIEEESAETQAEAIAMYASVASNGGFYIGRYEAGKDSNGNVVCKKGAAVYNNIGWNNDTTNNNITVETGGAVELARDFAEDNNYDTTKVHSTLCYSVQWDTALNFIDPGYTGYAKDGSKMGWYRDNYNSTNTGNEESNPNLITGKDLIYNNDVSTGIQSVTGSQSQSQSQSESTDGIIPAGEPTNMHKNIYDMAGNVLEWTMESCDTNRRAYRGGCYNHTASYNPASYRLSDSPSNARSDMGFRLALYL